MIRPFQMVLDVTFSLTDPFTAAGGQQRREWGRVQLSCQLAAGEPDCVHKQRHDAHDDDQTV